MQADESRRRVPDSDLEFDSDLTYSRDGALFTGVGYEDGPDGVLSEVSYRDGMQDGVSRDWYPSGVLMAESSYRMNVQHGPAREYDPAGRILEEQVFELGILVRSRTWDSTGHLVRSFEIDKHSPEYSVLEHLRRHSGLES